LIDFLSDDLSQRLAAMPGRIHILFTAHSLPERIIATGDRYPAELRSTAEAVAGKLGLVEGEDWSIAWQSAGRTPEPWIGPDILSVIDRLGSDDAIDGVVVCACGFVADHLEVLYDLDIEASQRAATRGIQFDRTASVMSALAARVHVAAG
jgi:ferrochelatase